MSPHIRTLVLAIAIATGMWAQSTYGVTTVARGSYDSYTANGINNRGQIVGTDRVSLPPGCIPPSPPGGCLDGFLYSGGALSPFLLGPPAAINNNGVIVGSSPYDYVLGTPLHTQAYLCTGAVSCSRGPWTLLGFLGGMDSGANGINDNGQVVGYATNASGNAEAFLYSGGVVTGLGFLPAGTQSGATGINNSGQVVGYSTNASGKKEAFLYSGGVVTGLGTLPGYTDSVATAINGSGQVVGYATDSSGNSQAFLYSDGVMTGLGTLPDDFSSEADAINNVGQIVGYSVGPGTLPGTRTQRAFLYAGGQMYDLNSLVANPSALTEATGINDSGQIIANSSGSAYLLMPLQGRFVPLTPCRVADTRTSPGPFGGPALDGVSARYVAVPQSACGVPATAQAYSLNVTVVPRGPLSYLTLWPTGLDQPVVSTLNSFDGNVVANAAIVPAGQNGAVSVYATNPTDVILDINGYFDAAAGDSFYPLPPCRVADTRNPAGPFGRSLSAGETRDYPVLSSACGLPAAATAYSMNVTVVPAGFLGFLTTWGAGQAQPFVSTLNSWTGKVVANAAIVPSGANGATSVYVTNPTEVILDANGYFAPPGNPGALSFYPVVPCRVADTRDPDGPFGGPTLEAGTTRSFAIPAGDCAIPSGAAGYSLNVTVVPDGRLSYLTAWPTGAARPYVSTLNSWDGTVVANAAIVPSGSGGAVSLYVTDRTHVILDITGYFAP